MMKILIGLAVTYVVTFACGFLQATPYNFLNYVFFAVLGAGGAVLINTALNAPLPLATKSILVLAGLSAGFLFVFLLVYDLLRLTGFAALSATFEGVLYLLTAAFWGLVITGMVMLSRSPSPTA